MRRPARSGGGMGLSLCRRFFLRNLWNLNPHEPGRSGPVVSKQNVSSKYKAVQRFRADVAANGDSG